MLFWLFIGQGHFPPKQCCVVVEHYHGKRHPIESRARGIIIEAWKELIYLLNMKNYIIC